MFKVRLALYGALTLFALSGVVTSVASASGPFWHVGGSKFTEGTRQLKLQSKGALVLKSPEAKVEIECKNSISEGATIEGSKETQGQGKGRVTYSSCVTLKPTTEGCALLKPVITTNPLKSYLAYSVTPVTQTKIVEVFEPGQGSVFVTFEMTPQCGAALEKVGVTGNVAAEVIPARVEGQEGMIAFPSPIISEVNHEGVIKKLQLSTILLHAVFTGVYGARLANFPEKFGAFDQ